MTKNSMSSDRPENRCAGVFLGADHDGNINFPPKCPLVCSHGNVFLPVTTPCSRLGWPIRPWTIVNAIVNDALDESDGSKN